MFNKLNFFCPECLSEAKEKNKYCRFCIEFRSEGVTTFKEVDKKRFEKIWKKLNTDKPIPENPTAEDIFKVEEYFLKNIELPKPFKNPHDFSFPFRIMTPQKRIWKERRKKRKKK